MNLHHASVPPLVTSDWQSECWRRVKFRPWLKIFGVTLFIWVFFLGYFEVLQHPVFQVTTMPLTVVDHWMPFQFHALWPYLSLWFYVGIAPGLLGSMRGLLSYAGWAAAMCVTGLVCFYVWPTAVPPFDFDVSGYPGFAILKGVDRAGNACPSLHVASAMFTAIWLEALLRSIHMPWGWRVVNGCWLVAIAYSTLATKQHVALDVMAGAALGGIFALTSLRLGSAMLRAMPDPSSRID